MLLQENIAQVERYSGWIIVTTETRWEYLKWLSDNHRRLLSSFEKANHNIKRSKIKITHLAVRYIRLHGYISLCSHNCLLALAKQMLGAFVSSWSQIIGNCTNSWSQIVSAVERWKQKHTGPSGCLICLLLFLKWLLLHWEALELTGPENWRLRFSEEEWNCKKSLIDGSHHKSVEIGGPACDSKTVRNLLPPPPRGSASIYEIVRLYPGTTFVSYVITSGITFGLHAWENVSWKPFILPVLLENCKSGHFLVIKWWGWTNFPSSPVSYLVTQFMSP